MNQAILILTMFDKNNKLENTGEVINEIQIQPARLENLDLKICMYICTIIMVLRFIYTLYKIQRKNLKKKFINAALNEVVAASSSTKL